MKKLSIRHDYFLLAGIFCAVIMLVFLADHMMVASLVKRNANENVAFLGDQIVSSITMGFDNLDNSSGMITYSKKVHDFLAEPAADKRYDYGMDVSETVQNALSKTYLLDAVVLFDLDGAPYRYSIDFSNDLCAELFERYKDIRADAPFTIATLNGRQYFMVAKPIYSISSPSPARVGVAMLFSNFQKMKSSFDRLSGMSGVHVCIAGADGTVHFANNDAMQQKNLSELPVFQSEAIRAQKISGTDLTIYLALDRDALFRYDNTFLVAMLLVLALFALLTLALVAITNKRILAPMADVIGQMRTLRGDSLRGRVRLPKENRDIRELAAVVNGMLDRTEDFARRAFHTQELLYETQLRKQSVELHLLRKQINAHFLFNALGSIRTLAEQSGSDDLVRLSDGLASIIRYAYSREENIDVFEEMEMLEKYVDIMNIRFQNKFAVEFDVDDILCGVSIPRQLLQPIVENAFSYGLEEKDRACELRIEGHVRGDRQIYFVSDNGGGMTEERLNDLRAALQRDEDDLNDRLSGVALRNIARRLRFLYGADYGLTIESALGKGTCVTIALPYQIKEEYSDGTETV